MKVCISLRLPDWCHKSRTRTTGSDSVRSNLAGRLSESLARLPLPLPACHLLSFAFALPARRSCCQAMSLVSQFVSHASQVFSAGSAPNLLASIPLDPSHPFYNPLHQALVSVRPIRSSLRGSEVQRTDEYRYPNPSYPDRASSDNARLSPRMSGRPLRALLRRY
jgi:hypothetical protein